MVLLRLYGRINGIFGVLRPRFAPQARVVGMVRAAMSITSNIPAGLEKQRWFASQSQSEGLVGFLPVRKKERNVRNVRDECRKTIV